jgi:hypothetical protein
MDEVKIGSGFIQGILTKIIAKAVAKKLGVNLNLNFNDPITVKFDGEQAIVHLNANAKLSKEDLGKLVKDLV